MSILLLIFLLKPIGMFDRLIKCLVLAFICYNGAVVGQTKRIDSLKLSLAGTILPVERLRAIFLLCEEKQSMQNDTLYAYAQQANRLAVAGKNQVEIFKANFYINISLVKKGMQETAIKNCNDAIQRLSVTNADNQLLLNYMHLKAIALMRGNLVKEAIAENYQLLQKAEALKDTMMQIKAKNGIGWGYMELGQFNDGIRWCRKALATTVNDTYYDKYTTIYNNISSLYNNIQQYDSALYFVEKSLSALRLHDDLTSEANAKNIKADILLNTHQIQPAQRLLEEALQVRMRIGDPYYVVSDIYQLAVFYAHNNQPKKGIATSLKGIETARQYNLASKLPLLYSGLAESYKMDGNMVGYSRVLERIIQVKDSLFEKNSAEALAGLQTQYDVQKKENIIIKQKLDILRRDYLIAGSVMLLVLLVMLAIYLYKVYRRRQHIKLQNLLKEQQEKETTAIYEAEENQRKRIAAELHDNLGAQISFISSNIDWIIYSPTILSEPEQKKRLQMVHETSQQLMRTLRETIWALNRDKIALDEFADKLKAYIQTFLQFQPELHFHSQEKIDTNIILKPLQALNMFRIFQEAVNNTFKYARADNLLLNIRAFDKKFEIHLTDDGEGFDPDKVNGEHYGLQIMKHRAVEAGFIFSLKSTTGSGTGITVSGMG